MHKTMLEAIYIASKQAKLHANDILDQQMIKHRRFVGIFTHASICNSIDEIIKTVNLTLTRRDVKVKMSRINSPIDEVRFDKRRLQQVLLNLL